MFCIGNLSEEHKLFLKRNDSSIATLGRIPFVTLDYDPYINDLLGIKTIAERKGKLNAIYRPTGNYYESLYLINYGTEEEFYIYDIREEKDQIWILNDMKEHEILINAFPDLKINKIRSYSFPKNTIWIIAFKNKEWEIKKYGLNGLVHFEQ